MLLTKGALSNFVTIRKTHKHQKKIVFEKYQYDVVHSHTIKTSVVSV